MAVDVDTEEPGLNMDNFMWGEDIRYRFENTTGEHNKFYEITLTEDDNGGLPLWTLVTAWGSMNPGAHVAHKSEDFSIKYYAEEKMNKHIRKRYDNGYRQVDP